MRRIVLQMATALLMIPPSTMRIISPASFAFVAVLSLAIAGCGQSLDPQQVFAQAKQSVQRGNSKEALVLLKNVLQLDPDNAEARYMLAVIENELGDYPSAEQDLRKARDLGYDAAQISAPLAWSLLMQGQYKKVLDETESSPDSSEILSIRGRAHLALGQPRSAVDSFDRALKLEPESAPALLGQAMFAVNEGKLQRADELVNSILAKQPNNMEAWLFAGDLYRMQGKSDKAAEAYDKAVQIQPDNFGARLGRAALLADTGKFDAAQQDINAARKVIGDMPLVDYTQGLLLFRQGKSQPALEAVQKVLRVVPDHKPSLLLAGLSHYSLNSLEAAERNVRLFLNQSPNSVYARKLLASILLKSNQGTRALEALEPALKTAQQDVQVLALAGEAYMQVRQFAKATDYLQRAANVAPTDADLRAKLGISVLGIGNNDRAIAELDSAANLDPGTIRVHSLLIMTYLAIKEYDKALAAATKLQNKQPENPLSYDLLGAVYLARKDQANARKSFERALGLKPDYVSAAMMLARLDLEAKDPDSARNRYKSILAKDGKNVQAMIGWASIERAMGNPKGYTSLLEKARDADAAALAPRMLLARHYLQTNDVNRALAAANEAKTLQPRHPDVLNLFGEVQSAAGDKTGAIATYGTLVSLLPQSPLAHYRLAMAYLVNEDYVAAAEPLRTALKLKADYVDARAALAMVEYRAQRYSVALSLAQQIQRQAPKLPVGYTLEGDSLMAQKKFALAQKSYEKAFSMRRSPALAVKLHSAASQAGNIQAANSRLLQWLSEHPTDTASRLYLADAYVKARENKLAIEQYQLVLKTDPNNLLAANNLGILYRQEKDPRALDSLEQSYKLKPDSTAIAHNLGRVLVEQGKLERGIEILRKAVAQAPENPEIRYHFAVALAQFGDKDQARRELERLLENKTEFPQKDEAEALLKRL